MADRGTGDTGGGGRAGKSGRSGGSGTAPRTGADAPPGGTPPGAHGVGGLRRTLGFRDLVVYGLLFIAPMAPVGVYGTLDAKSHGAVALVYVVATVAMAFTAFSYAQMIRVAPQAGSVFAYARKGLGEGPGFIAGWMAMLDYLLIPAVAYLFAGIAMEALVPSVDRWIWTGIAVVVTTLLNLWGYGPPRGSASSSSRWRSWCCWCSWCRRSWCSYGTGRRAAGCRRSPGT